MNSLSFETPRPRELVRRTMTASSFKQSALNAGYDVLTRMRRGQMFGKVVISHTQEAR